MRKVEKPWGWEEIWAENSDYVGKLLVIRAGRRLSLQHHQVKRESIRVAEGTMDLELEDESGQLVTHRMGPGDVMEIPPLRRHRMTAVTDCQIYEVSTPHLMDVVRHSDDYGREGTNKP